MAENMRKGPDRKPAVVETPGRAGFGERSGQVEAPARQTAIYRVGSEDQMERLSSILTEGGYECKDITPVYPIDNRWLIRAAGDIVLAGRKRAQVKATYIYNPHRANDYSPYGDFKVTTSDPVIKRALEEVGGRFDKVVEGNQ